MKFFILLVLAVITIGVNGKPRLRLSEVIGKGRTVRQVIDLGAYGTLPPTVYQPSPYAVSELPKPPQVFGARVSAVSSKPVTAATYSTSSSAVYASKPVVTAYNQAPAPVVVSAPAPKPATYSRVAPKPSGYLVESELEENYPPQPFQYSFDVTDEFGTQLTRQESGDGAGTVTGSYSYRDAQGLARIVRYIADSDGYRAEIQTNEPGTETSNPADAVIISSQPPTHKYTS